MTIRGMYLYYYLKQKRIIRALEDSIIKDKKDCGFYVNQTWRNFIRLVRVRLSTT